MKFIFYVIGIVVLALGIACTIISGLGTSPFDALLVGLSKPVCRQNARLFCMLVALILRGPIGIGTILNR